MVRKPIIEENSCHKVEMMFHGVIELSMYGLIIIYYLHVNRELNNGIFVQPDQVMDLIK